MGYLSILNLYKYQDILLFKECYALEKIHGTSAHISWKAAEKKVYFFSGGEKHTNFVALFDETFLQTMFQENFPDQDVKIFGEAYGGKQQRMSATYGPELKFVVFDVKIDKCWLNVPVAERVALKAGLEFVDYVKVSTDIEALNAERDKDSTQAIRNGCGTGKLREGVVLRPLIEVTTNNGERIMAKHKRDEFRETATPRMVSQEELQVLEDAKAIADEWCTPHRLDHVLQKLPQDIDLKQTKTVINAMVEDVYREGKGEIVESNEVTKAISTRAAMLFKKHLQKALEE